MNEEKTLKIFSAGVAKRAVSDMIERWNREHPGLKAELLSCGSVELARKIISGRRCEVFISADECVVNNMLMPEFAKGYIVFAGNKIVIEDMKGRGIDSCSWKEKLLDPAAVFRNKNPYADPGGYRGVMAMLLADKYEQGLSRKLMEHPGHIGMDPNLCAENMPDYDYLFTYYSMAKDKGAAFAELPAIMDLSDSDLNREYAQVEFSVDENTTVKGSAISHCITIPETAVFKDEARAFVAEFLKTDFTAYNFTQKLELVGEDIISKEEIFYA